LNQHIFRAEPIVEAEIEFLRHALTYVIEKAKAQFHGIEMKHLTKGALEEAEIVVPPLLNQKTFSDLVKQVREIEAKQAESRERLDALFQSMLDRAFQGEL
jgi:restriction endonuclease S subunit